MPRVLLALLMTAAAACSNPTAPDVTAGAPFQLQTGETALLAGGARLRFDAVRNDSRCPIDAICIRAGEATIAVSLARSDASFNSYELRTDAPASRVSFDKYVITLTELQPYPRSDRPARAEDYVATFIVDVP